MLAFLGTNTSAMFGAEGDWGKEACALSVSAILRNAGINIDDAYAPTLFQDLQKMGAVLVPANQARPGDIVFENGLGHVGIYCGGSPPCTGDVMSNSSSAGAFVWGSDMAFDPSYGTSPAYVLRFP